MPSLKDRELNSTLDSAALGSGGASLNSAGNRPQPVALEVPVTVNGARPLEGSDKRETFTESTKTVLVFDNGAVIRLGSTLAAGQLLFLTNEKTKKEVVCQVVKSKNYSNANGYVEVQFTEPVSGFWGLRFPADRSAIGSGTRPTTDSGGSAYSGGGMETNPPMVMAAQLETPSPAVERFKAELKAEERASSRAELLTSAEPSIEKVKLEANRLQEQLSTMLFAEPQSAPQEQPSLQGSTSKALSDTTAKLFELAEAKSLGATPPKQAQAELPSSKLNALGLTESPTQAKLAADALPAEELKVPSWLEPLARNVANSAPVEEKAADAPATPEPAAKTDKQEKPVKAAPPKVKAPEAPVFGKTLLGQSPSRAIASSSGSNKGLLVGAIAAAILIAAAVGTWYLRQSSDSAPASTSARTNVAPAAATQMPATSTSPTAESSIATVQGATGVQNDSASLTSQTPAANAAGGPVALSAASAPSQPAVRPAVISEKVPKAANPTSEVPANSMSATPGTSTEPDKKPSLGKIRLAKPQVSHNREPNGVAEPTLLEAGEQAAPANTALGAGLIDDNASQPAAPAAPTPVGGDVKPARLISSVPPVYPPIAKSQHIAGDVRIDALIDAHGRVSGMKVVSGPAQLQQAAMDALRQWKYQPAMLNGNAVAMHLTVTIQFHLQ